jgi:hypothetical protein
MLTENQARKRHEKGKLYTAILGDRAKPRCFLEFSAYRSVCVEFLDDALRSYCVFGFSEEQPDQLFLESAVQRRFAHPTGQQGDARVYYFKTDGRLFLEHYQIGPTGPSVMVDSLETHTDMTHNWEPFPKFGDYEGLATLDRGIPVLRPDEETGA